MWGHKTKPFKKGGLRMWVFSILQQSHSNGAEIMDQIEMATQGWWRPSPGSVYPLLEELQKEGSINKREDGRYELTSKGKQELESPWGIPTKQPHTTQEILIEIENYVSYLEDLNMSDKSKVFTQIEQLRNIKDRLAALIDSK
jgi:DNA-binding PadR family transcriptional regulator